MNLTNTIKTAIKNADILVIEGAIINPGQSNITDYEGFPRINITFANGSIPSMPRLNGATLKLNEAVVEGDGYRIPTTQNSKGLHVTPMKLVPVSVQANKVAA
jgi:Ni,Fe-hydrogenase III small subunit